MGPYALAAARHMHEYGTTSEQLAQIAVSTREWATLNPRARHREPLTVAEVLASPLQVSPLHLLDCCLVTDGAGAFVMTSAARARTLRKPPVYVLGTASCTDHMGITQMPDLTTTPGVVSGGRAFAMAGMTAVRRGRAHGVRQLHHHRAASPGGSRLLPEGRGRSLRRRGQARTGRGPLAMNTNGGGLSFTHPGMYGMFLVTEAVRQLRGECGERQVAGAEVAVAHGSGIFLSVMSTAVLGTEATL